jgi:hypothetical protein
MIGYMVVTQSFAPPVLISEMNSPVAHEISIGEGIFTVKFYFYYKLNELNIITYYTRFYTYNTQFHKKNHNHTWINMTPTNVSVMVFYNGERVKNATGVKFQSDYKKMYSFDYKK